MAKRTKPPAAPAAPAKARVVKATHDDVVQVLGCFIDGDRIDRVAADEDLRPAIARIRAHRDSLPDPAKEE